MKVSLTIYFDYDNKSDDDKEKATSDLLMNFGEFCENTEFNFQSIPRIGERIDAEPLLLKWTKDDGYDSKAFSRVFQALRDGSFLVEVIYHSFDLCTIHCSDIEDREIE